MADETTLRATDDSIIPPEVARGSDEAHRAWRAERDTPTEA